jgi:hypothetical protein
LQQHSGGEVEIHLRPGVSTRPDPRHRSSARRERELSRQRTAEAFLRTQRALLRLDDPTMS